MFACRIAQKRHLSSYALASRPARGVLSSLIPFGSPPPSRNTSSQAQSIPTANTAKSDLPESPPADSPKQRGRTARQPKRRQKLRVRDGQTAKVHPRALPVGTSTVYDQALRIINEDSATLRKELQDLRSRLEEARSNGDRAAVDQLEKKVHILEVQSQINLPRVRWRFVRGLVDMKQPVYRHLAEQKWRNDGALDMTMERVYQMNVVPDVLPAIHPTLDLRVMYGEKPPRSLYLRTRAKRRQVAVDPGVFLLPEQTRRPPTLHVTAFHTEPRFYTLVMIDPDSPNPENNSFRTCLHWIECNIELTCTSTRLQVKGDTYIPPHPQRGSPYHRYTLLLLQNPGGERLDIDAEAVLRDRDQFNTRDFCSTYGFSLDHNGPGGAAFMWREVWDETVSHIYEHTLKQPEPRYGKVPKFDLYSEVKEMNRYI